MRPMRLSVMLFVTVMEKPIRNSLDIVVMPPGSAVLPKAASQVAFGYVPTQPSFASIAHVCVLACWHPLTSVHVMRVAADAQWLPFMLLESQPAITGH